MLHIRAGVLEDIEAVRAIERAAAQRFLGTDLKAIATDEPTDAVDISERVEAGGLWIASEPGGGPIGFVMFSELDGCGYVEEIDVLPTYAGRGIGATLLEVVAQVARARGWPALTLSTFEDIPWNAPYYRRLGFVDLPQEDLTSGLRRVRADHVARGLDESRRVFMRRPI